MIDPSGRYWITFNGEIYNYQEVRAQLDAPFRTHSDTEVILAAYARWGAKCLDHFRGMYAFAIWDTETRTLFAARDLFGEKPLYYARTNDGALVLASEMKAIVASGLIAPKLDLQSVDAYLAFGYVPPHRTIYSNVETLPPGHFMEWSPDSGVRLTRYWWPRFEQNSLTVADAAEELRRLLRQSVKRQMVADVPVGAFLSGGLDSSTIVALMQQQSSRAVQTFSVGFGTYINELPYARAVAEKYGTEHHEIDLGAPAVGPLLETMAKVYDEPFADSSNIPTYLVSQFARRSVKVVLSGDGGDELFGGYGWYPSIAAAEAMKPNRAEWIALRGVSKLLRHRVAWLRERSQALGLAVRWSDSWQRTFMSQMNIRASLRRQLWGTRAPEIELYEPGDYYRPAANAKGLDRAFYLDLTNYLPGDILVKVDRASMAHGLETRAPFLDRDVAEFALSLPASLKVSDGKTKFLLRKACEQYWPEELRTRGKQGFGAPYDRWMQMPEVARLVSGVFAPGSALRTLLPGIPKEQASIRNYQTWTLLILGLWLQNNPHATA
jgi:asparagine synthase (glutamine-hydrolysing)